MQEPAFLFKTSKGGERKWTDVQPISEKSLALIGQLDSEIKKVLLDHKQNDVLLDEDDNEMSKEDVEAQIEKIQLFATDAVQELFSNYNLANSKYVLQVLHMVAELGLASLEHFRVNYLEDYFSFLIQRKRKTFEVFTSYDQLKKNFGEFTPKFNFWWGIHKQYAINIEKTKNSNTNRALANIMNRGKSKAERELLEVKIRTIAVIECPHTLQVLELNKIPVDDRNDLYEDAMTKCQYAITYFAQLAVDEWNKTREEEKDKKAVEAAAKLKKKQEYFSKVMVPELKANLAIKQAALANAVGSVADVVTPVVNGIVASTANGSGSVADVVSPVVNGVVVSTANGAGSVADIVTPVVSDVDGVVASTANNSGSVAVVVTPVVNDVDGVVASTANAVRSVTGNDAPIAIPVAEIVGCIVQASSATTTAEKTTKGMFESLTIY